MKSGKYGNMLCVKSQFICEYVCQANQVTARTQEDKSWTKIQVKMSLKTKYRAL